MLTPFAGIGSEVYQAVKMGRRGIGIELKKSYFDIAVRNVRDAEASLNQATLLDFIGEGDGDDGVDGEQMRIS